MSVISRLHEALTPTSDALLIDVRIPLPPVLVVGNRQQVRQQVLDLLDTGARRIALDLTGTNYIDASGLGVLVSVRKKILDEGGQLWLEGPNEDLEVLFDLTGIRRLFDFAAPGTLRVREG